MCSLSECGRYWVNSMMSNSPELTQFDSTKSMMRYLPANGTAGLARLAVSTPRREPSPPARIAARVFMGGSSESPVPAPDRDHSTACDVLTQSCRCAGKTIYSLLSIRDRLL